MCLRLSAKDLIGNLVGSEGFRYTDVLSLEKLREFRDDVSQLIPGYIYFDLAPEDMEEARRELSPYCAVDKEWNIRLREDGLRPDRAACNRGLDSRTARMLAQLADYFVDTELEGRQEMDPIVWFLDHAAVPSARAC